MLYDVPLSLAEEGSLRVCLGKKKKEFAWTDWVDERKVGEVTVA